MPPAGRPRAILIGLVVWYVVTMAVWGVRPLTDHVPIVFEYEEEVERSTQMVRCHAPWSRDISVRGTVPDLDAGWVYERQPCQAPIRGAWRLVLLNTVVVVVGGVGVTYWAVRRRDDSDQDLEILAG